jgi:hypothetical protein
MDGGFGVVHGGCGTGQRHAYSTCGSEQQSLAAIHKMTII